MLHICVTQHFPGKLQLHLLHSAREASMRNLVPPERSMASRSSLTVTPVGTNAPSFMAVSRSLIPNTGIYTCYECLLAGRR